MSGVVFDQEICHYEVMGHGRPVVFIHDWLGSWRYWMPAMQMLASLNFKAIAIDLWGFGDSARNKRAYQIKDQTKLIDNFLNQLNLEKVALVGHGYGAVLAMNYAGQQPHRVDRVFFVSPPMVRTGLHEKLSTDTPYQLAKWLLEKESEAELVLEEIHKVDLQALRVSLQEVKSLPLQDLWNTVQQRSLLLHGGQDQAISGFTVEEFLSLPEHMHGIWIEQGGHFPMLEDTSKFSRILVDFLMLASQVSPRTLNIKDQWIRRVR